MQNERNAADPENKNPEDDRPVIPYGEHITGSME